MNTKYEIISADSGEWVRMIVPEVPSLLSLKTDLPKYVPIFPGFRNEAWIQEFIGSDSSDDSHQLVLDSLCEASIVLPFLFPLYSSHCGRVENVITGNLTGDLSCVCIGLEGNTRISLFDCGHTLDIGVGDLVFIPGGPLFKTTVYAANSSLFVGYASSQQTRVYPSMDTLRYEG